MLGHPYRKLNSSQNATSTSHSGSPVNSNKDASSTPSQVFCNLFYIIYSLLRFITLCIGVNAVMWITGNVVHTCKTEAYISSWIIVFVLKTVAPPNAAKKKIWSRSLRTAIFSVLYCRMFIKIFRKINNCWLHSVL